MIDAVPEKIVLATGNPGKVNELSELLKELSVSIIPQSEFNVSEVAETGTTFVENALIKARHASTISGLPAIADDSGLSVDYLQGAPGIYSSRYAGEQATDQQNIDKLLETLSAIPPEQRLAHFHCVIVYLQHPLDPTPIICHGSWHGEITTQCFGEQGFGYDPIFWLSEYQQTSAQLSRQVKNSISHRSQALKQFITEFSAQYQR